MRELLAAVVYAAVAVAFFVIAIAIGFLGTFFTTRYWKGEDRWHDGSPWHL